MSSRIAWNNAIALNQIKSPDWQPDEEYLELIEREIHGEITIEEMLEILIKKYKVEE